jgi:aerobic carbon-monoxide dehydrogenase large subunit
MEKFGKSQPVRRFEDQRFLTGQGRYVDDIAPEAALHAFVFRSPVAHARIAGLDTGAAAEAPGVALVLTAADLVERGATNAMETDLVRNRDGSRGAAPVRPFLAEGKVSFVGEPVALVVAETLDQARDAAELIGFETEELAVSVGLEPGGPTIHEEAPGNLAYDYALGDVAAVERAMEGAAHRVTTRVEHNRIMVASMEPRGAYAEWDGAKLHLCVNGQGVWGQKDELVAAFGLKPEAVRVTNPDVGGGFGMKGMTYPEYFAIAAAAMTLGRPVRWMSDRTEAMLSDNAGRDLVSETELAFDADHRMLAYRVRNVSNLGAYNSGYAQHIQSSLFAKVLMGVYDCQTTLLEVRGVFTNTAPVDAYRGAGRPEAIFALERSMDNAARVMGVDGWELRRKNFIPAGAFPYRSATGEKYDVGDFHRVLARVERECDRAGFAARKAEAGRRGRLRGLGLCYYIESILGDAVENAKVVFEADGTVSLHVGTQSNGQGHETVYAQFLSDQTGIPVERIRIVQGDSDLIAWGGGTGGSRSTTVQNNVTLDAVGDIVAGFRAFVAGEAGVEAAKVAFDDERFRAEGSNLTPTMMEVADMARAKGRADLLTWEKRSKLPGRSYPNGAHVAEVEIDPETGVTEVVRYTVTDDFGNLLNPMLAEGQVHGGVAQGIGQAITERVVYDDNGQLLTASFMDYALPRADDLPMFGFSTEPVPSTANQLGMKGCGEAGTVGALAAVSNAVADALWERGVTEVQMPFTSLRVWEMLRQVKVAAE